MRMGVWGMRMIPAARSRAWLLWLLVYGLLLSVMLGICRFVGWSQHFDVVYAFRLSLLAFAMTAVIHFFGWLGAKWVWISSTLGIVIGLVLMFIYASRDMDGWEELASFLVFLEGAVLGFVTGLIVEGLHLIWLRLRK
ncbi:hypothetical protein [Gorillibacterium massiliense]|uniref:hypothetical protein n=1 Tax=Gorillibacterium massiliense TaxID=1280390 RepID=UPI0004AD6E54|nr:hypothetical protein [Gorillibacterium massiliense]